jgi:acyl dehydratase
MSTAPSLVHTMVEGFRTQRAYEITPELYCQFLESFGDTSRLHTDDEFSRRCGFPGLLTHGAILNGFISHFIGVQLPCDARLQPAVLEHSVRIQYRSPCHVGDRILVEGVVKQVSEAVGVAIIELVMTNLTRNRVAANVKVQVGLMTGNEG